jgi:murein DD-endopeptidase MepM/ murein hydrolase activator NlpD
MASVERLAKVAGLKPRNFTRSTARLPPRAGGALSSLPGSRAVRRRVLGIAREARQPGRSETDQLKCSKRCSSPIGEPQVHADARADRRRSGSRRTSARGSIRSTGLQSFHEGIDFPAEVGTPWLRERAAR